MNIRGTFEEMIKVGLLIPTGETRHNRRGELEPVYVLSETGKAAATRVGLVVDERTGKRGGATADETDDALST